MITLYVDESGDLGPDCERQGTSRHFVLTGLVCRDPRAVAKAVRAVYSTLSSTDKQHHHGVLHAYALRPATRRRLLTQLAALEIRVVAAIVDKALTPRHVLADQHGLYSDLADHLLNEVLARGSTPDGVLDVVVSQRETSAALNRAFTRRLLRHGRWAALNVSISPASGVKGLQAVDCVSWSLFRWIEYGDDSYAALIESKLVLVDYDGLDRRQ